MNETMPESRPGHRILVVAAGSSLREESAAALRAVGYHAEGTGDVESGWSALCRQGYELLIVDRILPGKSGLRLVLRMSRANLTTPVVLVTEDSSPFDPQTHRQFRLVTVLPRPFGVERLLKVVCVILQNEQPAKREPSRVPLIGAGTNSPRHPGRNLKKRVRLSSARPAAHHAK